MEVEYASKAATNTAVTLGAIGTGLGVLNSNSNGNGLLGGLLGGGNNNQVMALMSENATLKSEKYTDSQIAELYRAKVRDDKELTVFASNIDKRLGALEVAFPLQAQITDGKIAAAVSATECCYKATNAALASLQAQFGTITKFVVPNTAVCPGWGNVTVTPATTPAAG